VRKDSSTFYNPPKKSLGFSASIKSRKSVVIAGATQNFPEHLIGVRRSVFSGKSSLISGNKKAFPRYWGNAFSKRMQNS